MASRLRRCVGRNDHLPCERFSQFNDEHPEFGETMPNLLDVPAVGANGISEEMLYPTGESCCYTT